jgi:hypothetical protein
VSRGGGERPTNTGHVVKLDSLQKLSDELAARSPAERVQMFGIDVARSD